MSPIAANDRRSRHAAARLRIVVLGYLVRGPIGGMAWHHLQYVLGLRQLGHDVLFLEDSDDYPSCYDPTTHNVGTDPTYGLAFATQAFNRLQMPHCWAYHDSHREQWHGPAAERAIDFCRESDLLINVSGVNPLSDWMLEIPCRVFIDTDPVFTQVRHLTDESARARAAMHNVFLSFGELIESGSSRVPNDGFPWRATRQPIVLDAWPVRDAPGDGKFTTVMQWESYPAVEFAGQRYGMKSESFVEFQNLPSRASTQLEIALGGSATARQALQQRGWLMVDSLAVTRDPWTYQDYVQQSAGEFSVAKHGYVAGHSGWFSERSACYLASGRPVATLDTGFSNVLPCGRGLWAFCDLESALSALEQIQRNYASECAAARAIAVEYFHSDNVLGTLIERALGERVPPLSDANPLASNVSP